MIELAGRLTIVFILISLLGVAMDVRGWNVWRRDAMAVLLFWGTYLAYKVFMFMWYGVQ